MGAVETTGAANDRHEPEAIDDRTIQATSVAVVAASLVVWWPAFDLGAYGVIFFQQLLSLWAASTAVFLVSLTAGRRARLSWPRRLALLLPSLWLLLALAVPEGGAKAWSRALFYLAILLTMAGTPYPRFAAPSGDHRGICADTKPSSAPGGRHCCGRGHRVVRARQVQ